MIERILLVVVLAAVGFAFFHLFQAVHKRRMQSAIETTGSQPRLLYFRSESCGVCPAQGRIIDQLAEQWSGRLQIDRIDVEQQPEEAARYRVLSLPTTVLIDANGQIGQVNYGLADVHKLNRQLSVIFNPVAGVSPLTMGTQTESSPAA